MEESRYQVLQAIMHRMLGRGRGGEHASHAGQPMQ